MVLLITEFTERFFGEQKWVFNGMAVKSPFLEPLFLVRNIYLSIVLTLSTVHQPLDEILHNLRSL